MNTSPDDLEYLDKVRRPGIWLRRTPGRKTLSRLGGLPSLPTEIDWPRQHRMETPLHFLAQLDLSEMPATPLEPGGPALPKVGILYFFGDLDEELTWHYDAFASTRVLFNPVSGPDRELPEDLPQIFYSDPDPNDDYGTGIRHFPEAPLQAFVIDTFAGYSIYKSDEISAEVDRKTLASIQNATHERVPELPYDGSVRAEDQPVAVSVFKDKRDFSLRRHFLLGAASDVQNAADEARDKGDVSLIQIDTDWGVHKHFQFCDMGMAQFWIKADDLARGRFDRAWGTTEGG